MGKEIKIKGAGLAGLTAGINLVKAGYKVMIFELREDVGMRFNNDFQGIANWMAEKDVLELLKEMNIEINFLAEPIFKTTIWGPKLSTNVKLKSIKPMFYLVKRGNFEDCLDFSLKQQFIKEGCQIIFNQKNHLNKADIDATGPQKPNVIAVGYTFETDLEDTSIVITDNNIAPQAYAYLLVKDNKGTLAVVLTEKFQQKEVYFERAIKAFKSLIDFKIMNEKKFGGFGNFNIPSSAIRDKTLLVGETAGFQDFLGWFGMLFAIRSGFLAAKSIIENKNYDLLWKEEFEGLLKASMVNRFLIECSGNKGYRLIIRKIAKYKDDVTDLIKKEYSFSWKRKLLYPLAYCFKKLS